MNHQHTRGLPVLHSTTTVAALHELDGPLRLVAPIPAHNEQDRIAEIAVAHGGLLGLPQRMEFHRYAWRGTHRRQGPGAPRHLHHLGYRVMSLNSMAVVVADTTLVAAGVALFKRVPRRR